MPSVDSITTFSGLFILFGSLAIAFERPSLGAILYIIIGSAGVGIFWDRWSARTGHQDQITTIFKGELPSIEELVLLATHGPLLLLGLVILMGVIKRAVGSNEGPIDRERGI